MPWTFMDISLIPKSIWRNKDMHWETLLINKQSKPWCPLCMVSLENSLQLIYTVFNHIVILLVSHKVLKY